MWHSAYFYAFNRSRPPSSPPLIFSPSLNRFNRYVLRFNFRLKDDKEFAAALGELRLGKMTMAMRNLVGHMAISRMVIHPMIIVLMLLSIFSISRF
jgi:hypothetical protein